MAANASICSLFIVIAFLGFNLISAVKVGDTESGKCSWYAGPGTTANGEWFDGSTMTAAHKTLPFNTMVRTSFKGRSVTLRINDRGPFVAGRILDVSRRAAEMMGTIDTGVWDCTLTIVSLPK
ncbi:endolytic peptidoglycan transglycosylase RlpA-like [Aphidius gifuensis]|uniref:endolytic peptidoglycan transglycosylase RlpA-like n=1 Tax=Aphidius gifuensis TaxID=684658 RepID=UPI001CDC298A|nr:endolytic peptidoglycan transglycosylase RlpA-like [Aphidius gifuensis]